MQYMYCRLVPNKTTVLVEAALGKARDKDTSVTAWDVSTYSADTHLLICLQHLQWCLCQAHSHAARLQVCEHAC